MNKSVGDLLLSGVWVDGPFRQVLQLQKGTQKLSANIVLVPLFLVWQGLSGVGLAVAGDLSCGGVTNLCLHHVFLAPVCSGSACPGIPSAFREVWMSPGVEQLFSFATLCLHSSFQALAGAEQSCWNLRGLRSYSGVRGEKGMNISNGILPCEFSSPSKFRAGHPHHHFPLNPPDPQGLTILQHFF